jgi:predicted DNA-binding protein (MmcQ/YjbR family)
MARMTRDELRARCLALPHATEDFPFGEHTAVLRVAGKMFALLPVAGGSVNLKCEPERARDLRIVYDAIRPGYHQDKRHWNTVALDGDVDDTLLTELIEDSYDLVVSKLPRRVRDALDIRTAAGKGSPDR